MSVITIKPSFLFADTRSPDWGSWAATELSLRLKPSSGKWWRVPTFQLGKLRLCWNLNLTLLPRVAVMRRTHDWLWVAAWLKWTLVWCPADLQGVT